MERFFLLTRSMRATLIALTMVLLLAGCIDSESDKPLIGDPEAPPSDPAMPEPPMSEPPMAGPPMPEPPMSAPPTVQPPMPVPPGQDVGGSPETDTEAARFLMQATFGATMADVEQLRQMDYAAWIDMQMDPAQTPPTLIVPYLNELEATVSKNKAAESESREHFWFYQALNAEDQLRMRMAYALSQIFVVSKNDIDQRRGYLHLADYYDTLSMGAFGSYRDLLEQVTLHPTMGIFLDHANNAKADPEKNTFPDQNYARESMQLFSIGLVELNMDNTPRLDPNGDEIPTYDDDLIAEFAKVYTGWTFAGQGAGNFGKTSYDSHAPMECVPQYHEDSPKVLFNGQTIPGGSDCQATLDQALDILANHPNVPPFMSRLLIQRLVTSNPSPDYIQRVAMVWLNTAGDLGEVVKAILMDPEARILGNNPAFGKAREPVIKLSAFIRAFGSHYQPQEQNYINFRNREWNFRQIFGQDILSAPSVFNFYLPTHQPSGFFKDNNLFAPELELLNEASMNAHFTGMDGMYKAFTDELPMEDMWGPHIDLRAIQALANEGRYDEIVERINLLLFGGGMAMQTQTMLTQLFQDMSQDSNVKDPVSEVIKFVFFIPEFNAQR